MPEHSAGAHGDGELVRVIRSADCPVGTPQEPELRLVSVGPTQMIVVRLTDGEVVAFTSRCPHQGTDLSDASFFEGRLRCPYHLYLYDPRTGENLVPARDARPENLWKLKPGYLPTYRVEERDGWIWVAPGPRPPPPSYEPEQERRPTGTPSRVGDTAPVDLDPEPGEREGPVEHPTKTVRVNPGATFELRLPVAPRPGHVWRVEVVDGPLEVVEERFDPTDPPRQRVTLTAPREGVTTLRCVFGRPWDAVPAEIRTYLVRIEPEP
ncbi:MAG: Rieske 2Fe-2S domain-containing protein [Actinomycetota bacterium]|nr:Rieske 2Fe-2S domain-containing protein [Actinomycetota bacterium]